MSIGGTIAVVAIVALVMAAASTISTRPGSILSTIARLSPSLMVSLHCLFACRSRKLVLKIEIRALTLFSREFCGHLGSHQPVAAERVQLQLGASCSLSSSPRLIVGPHQAPSALSRAVCVHDHSIVFLQICAAACSTRCSAVRGRPACCASIGMRRPPVCEEALLRHRA